MNVAMIIAGGVGSRTGNKIPKQFINVNDKPIIIYTLERFQKHQMVDSIEVVCLDGWHDILQAYAEQFGIAKLKYVVSGGSSSQESIKIGLDNLKGVCGNDDIVVIHDGIRPMVDENIITSCIETCNDKGNGVTAYPVYEQIFETADGETADKYIPREGLRIVQTPQAYKYGEISDVYTEGFEKNIGIHGSAYANTLMSDMGNTLYFSVGSTKNIKITTKDDIAIFKAMLNAENEVGIGVTKYNGLRSKD